MKTCARPLPVLRAYESYDVDQVSDSTGLRCEDPSRAIQSQRDEADINTIVRNFGITGKVPENLRLPTYGDFSGIDDYRTAIHAVRQAEEAFLKVPADIRACFENDPQQFVEFCSERANLDELRKMGLAPAGDPPAGAPPAS